MTIKPKGMNGNAGGFTLVEVLSAIALFAILMAVAFPTIRTFWFRQSLSAATSDLIAEARAMQGKVTAESHPLVYGIRFSEGAMMADGVWGLVEYDPKGAPGGLPACTQYSRASAASGVFNSRISITSAAFTSGAGTPEQQFCRSSLKDAAGNILTATDDEFLFFYARGTATGGSVVLRQPNLGAGDDVTLQVFPLTGRIEQS